MAVAALNECEAVCRLLIESEENGNAEGGQVLGGGTTRQTNGGLQIHSPDKNQYVRRLEIGSFIERIDWQARKGDLISSQFDCQAQRTG